MDDVNPQAENGHVDIANEIVRALMVTQLSGYQSRYLWCLWSKTYGWHKKEDWISNSQFSKLTNIARPHIARTESELIERRIITKNGNKVAFNKIYTQWRELPKMVTVTKNGNSVTKNGNSLLPKLVHTKETLTKETYTKEIPPLPPKGSMGDSFETFWKVYPRKTGKGAARKIWARLKPSNQLLHEVVAAVRAQLQSEQWQREDGRFIPHPATWLNQERWQDEIVVAPQVDQPQRIEDIDFPLPEFPNP